MFPETEKWTITFKDREVFNEWTDTDLGFYDIGYSDMTLLFNNEEDWLSTQGCIIWNHLKEGKDFTTEGEISGKEYD